MRPAFVRRTSRSSERAGNVIPDAEKCQGLAGSAASCVLTSAYCAIGSQRSWQCNGLGKKTGQICRREKSSVSDLELGSLAGFFALIWSNLCTRYIPDKLTPRGHHDWPDKGVIRRLRIDRWPIATAVPPKLIHAQLEPEA